MEVASVTYDRIPWSALQGDIASVTILAALDIKEKYVEARIEEYVNVINANVKPVFLEVIAEKWIAQLGKKIVCVPVHQTLHAVEMAFAAVTSANAAQVIAESFVKNV